MNAIHVSGADSTQGRTALRSLTPSEQYLLDILSQHEVTTALASLPGSPSQRVLALLADLLIHVTRESDAACKTLLDGLELFDFATCAVRPVADCGTVFPREGDRDARRRVVVVDPRTEDDAEPALHLCCSDACADTLLRSWRVA